jgi:hypothetical protein
VARVVGSACGGDVVGVLSGEALTSWVAESCRAQGVPFKVTDARTMAKVLAVLNGRPDRSGPVRSGRPGGRSEAPDQSHPIRVEASCATGSRADVGMVEDHIDNRPLPTEVEVCPLSA